MTKSETITFLKKIRAYYPMFKIDEYGIEEWSNKLEAYEQEDVIEKFEEHLKGERSEEIPKLHYLIKYLRTKEEKEKLKNVKYTIMCDKCRRWMTPYEYEKHFDKCLEIQTILVYYKKIGNKNITREMLEEYDIQSLDKILSKFLPNFDKPNSLEGILKNV